MKYTKKSNKSADYLCGTHAITLCLEQQNNPSYHAKPKELWISGTYRPHDDLIKLAKEKKIPIITHENSREPSDDISRDLFNHKQLLWIQPATHSIDQFDWDKAKTIAIVDHITDTQNLGAIIRSACAMGVDALFYPKHTQASITPRVRFIAQGSTEFLPAYQINNINQIIAKAQQHHFWVYGFSETGTQSLPKTEFSDKSILIIGSEDCGIRKQTLQACDFNIQIPSDSRFSCLNAASAASIVFYERHRQRHLND